MKAFLLFALVTSIAFSAESDHDAFIARIVRMEDKLHDAQAKGDKDGIAIYAQQLDGLKRTGGVSELELKNYRDKLTTTVPSPTPSAPPTEAKIAIDEALMQKLLSYDSLSDIIKTRGPEDDPGIQRELTKYRDERAALMRQNRITGMDAAGIANFDAAKKHFEEANQLAPSLTPTVTDQWLQEQFALSQSARDAARRNDFNNKPRTARTGE